MSQQSTINVDSSPHLDTPLPMEGTVENDGPVQVILGPHHDGSPLYVPTQTPTLGQKVPLRIRIPVGSGVEKVILRVIRDAEPYWVPAELEESNSVDGDEFYRAEVSADNHVTNYRFLLDRGEAGSSWLNGTGEHYRDVTDQHDFRLTVHDPGPDWALDDVVYQIFPDRFATTGPKPTPDWAVAAEWTQTVQGSGPDVARQFYSGDLPGIVEHLDHLAELGISTVYLTPIFPASSNHRYNATSFDRVDPLLGGDQALAALSTAVHARGMRLIGDLTSNHSGDDHEWFISARADPAATERSYYYIGEDNNYLAWLGIDTLPKFNMSSDALRDRMFGVANSVVAKWLQEPYNLDGWRIDVANMTGRNGPHDDNTAVARQIRATMDVVKPGSTLIAEHCHDASGDLVGDGWQGTMNYAGFTRPVWCWLTSPTNPLNFLGVPARVPQRDGGAIAATMRDFAASVSWKVASRNWNLLDSHDTPRMQTITDNMDLTLVGAALLFTYPGTPMVFSGDEIGLTGVNGEDSRTPFPWQDRASWDERTLRAYQELIHLRRHRESLRRGGLRWLFAVDDAIGYLRETTTERILVVASRQTWEGATLPSSLATQAQRLYGTTDLVVDSAGIQIAGDGPGVGIWLLH